MTLRVERVAEAIRKSVSLIIHDRLKDPRLGFVTITRVNITADLRDAFIYYSVLGKEEDYKRTKEALESASGFIRSLLGRMVELRFVPHIYFGEDRSSEHSVRIQEILDEIKTLELAKDESAKEKAVRDKKRREEKGGTKKRCRSNKK